MFEFANRKGFKTFMARLYGWGASLVILGALFKIQHWPGAGLMLTLGLTTESLIFFFSAFEKPHEEPDWSLVYPELAGIEDGEGGKKEKKKLQKAQGATVTQEIDKMLEDAKIGPELIESLGAGLRNLSDSTSKMAEVSSTVVANNEFTSNMKAAAQSVSELNTTYKKTNEALTKDIHTVEEFANTVKNTADAANGLSNAYQQASEAVKNDAQATTEHAHTVKEATNSVNMLKTKYVESAESLAKSAEAVDFSSIDTNAYQDQILKVTKNLEALNSVYELQLASVSGQLDTSKTVREGMDKFLGNLEKSVETSNQYQELVNNLNQNMAILNKVYGNMLAAMNVNINK